MLKFSIVFSIQYTEAQSADNNLINIIWSKLLMAWLVVPAYAIY